MSASRRGRRKRGLRAARFRGAARPAWVRTARNLPGSGVRPHVKPDFDELKVRLRASGVPIKSLVRLSGVPRNAVRPFYRDGYVCDGRAQTPTLKTLARVAVALVMIESHGGDVRAATAALTKLRAERRAANAAAAHEAASLADSMQRQGAGPESPAADDTRSRANPPSPPEG